MNPLIRGIAISFLILFAGAPASANELVEMSYADKLRESSLVIVGRATRDLDRSASPIAAVTEVAVLARMKGSSPATIRIYSSSPIVEDDPRCCERGAVYLMFLQRAAPGIYASTNGHFGIIRIGR